MGGRLEEWGEEETKIAHWNYETSCFAINRSGTYNVMEENGAINFINRVFRYLLLTPYVRSACLLPNSWSDQSTGNKITYSKIVERSRGTEIRHSVSIQSDLSWKVFIYGKEVHARSCSLLHWFLETAWILLLPFKPLINVISSSSIC